MYVIRGNKPHLGTRVATFGPAQVSVGKYDRSFVKTRQSEGHNIRPEERRISARAVPCFCPDVGLTSISMLDPATRDGHQQHVISILGQGIGKVFVVAVFLCGTAAKIIRQSDDELLVCPAPYHKGLSEPILGSIEVQNIRFEVLMFPAAFVYLPSSQMILHTMETLQQHQQKNADYIRWDHGELVNTDYMASKISPSHSISLGLDELGFTIIRHWHAIFLHIDTLTHSLYMKIPNRQGSQLLANLSKTIAPAEGGVGTRLEGHNFSPDRTPHLRKKAFQVIVERERRCGRPFCVSLSGPGGFHVTIQATNEEAQRLWAAALQRAINGGTKGPSAEDLLPPGIACHQPAKGIVSHSVSNCE